MLPSQALNSIEVFSLIPLAILLCQCLAVGTFYPHARVSVRFPPLNDLIPLEGGREISKMTRCTQTRTWLLSHSGRNNIDNAGPYQALAYQY